MDSNLSQPTDQFNRSLRDLRISVTDRCNFRCIYCMPKSLFGPDHTFLPRADILSFEEVERTVRLFSKLGVTKIRITGGEPLIRKDLDKLIAKIKAVPGIQDISLTTNGALLSAKKAQLLADCGLNRITLSLDAIEPESFKKINDVQFPLHRVLEAIENAKRAGLNPVKVNTVVMKDINVDQILPMVDYFRQQDVILRFIEFMDVGSTNQWQHDKVVSTGVITELINSHFPIEPIEANYNGEVAKRWRHKDGAGELGMISSVTAPFCGSCHRARLSAQGKLYTCLFASQGYDLRARLRSSDSEGVLLNQLSSLWRARDDRYSQTRGEVKNGSQKVEMSYIGG